MSTLRQFLLTLAILAAPLTGCETTSPRQTISFAPVPNPAISQPGPASTSIVTVSHEEPAAVPPAGSETNADGLSSSDVTTRDRIALDELVAEVQERNPTAHAMYAAWQAAAQKYPQVVALDDPMFMYMVAPQSYASSSPTPNSWTVQLSQKYPGPGKRDARGQVAAWEAHAAGWDVETTRRQLAAAAKLAFFDYQLVFEQMRLNQENLKLLQELRDLARIKYESNQVPEQDVLQAEVELGERKLREVELEQMRRVAAGRINTLLHRPADSALSPPEKPNDTRSELPGVDDLTSTALEQNPDLAAKAARLASEQAAVELAAKEFWPDVDLFARHDTFWFDREQRTSIGFSLNLPVQRERRRAAVSEAVARVNQRSAELESQSDQVRFDVQSAHAKLEESQRTLEVYRRDILPTSEQNVSTTRSAYEAGTATLLPLVEAQRKLIDYREKVAAARAEQQRRWAELERVVGNPSLGR